MLPLEKPALIQTTVIVSLSVWPALFFSLWWTVHAVSVGTESAQCTMLFQKDTFCIVFALCTCVNMCSVCRFMCILPMDLLVYHLRINTAEVPIFTV